jgi:predicted ArsR family transcriptional regulator
VKLSTHQANVDTQVASVASLGEPVRRTLYRYVAAQPEPVSREQAAAGVSVAHHVAKFHLDKLEEDGLLEVEYHRPTGRTGPGAGRPTKFYRRAARDIAVSLPERRYDLAGRLMAEAIMNSTASEKPVSDTLRAAAHSVGQKMGRQAAELAGPRAGSTALVKAVCGVLDDNGYEPRNHPTCITLNNCPFHRLAADYTELVCGMNLNLITGLVNSLDSTTLRPRLDPADDRCCVTITHPAMRPTT